LDDITANLDNAAIQILLSPSKTKTPEPVILIAAFVHATKYSAEKPGCTVHKWFLWFISVSG
jgi:hypothetical protein